jgi:hypothetical protein
MELERYGDFRKQRLADGIATLTYSHQGKVPIFLSELQRGAAEQYSVGPYVLSQFYWVTLALGEPFWERFAGMVMASTFDAKITETQVQELLQLAVTSSVPDPNAFHDEWVLPGRKGVPLLGLAEMQYIDPTPTPEGWSGLSVFEYKVEQVQKRMKGWDLYTHVPYAIGCEVADSATHLRPFSECIATTEGLDHGAGAFYQDMYGAQGKQKVLHARTGMGTLADLPSLTPTFIGLLRGEQLGPGPQIFGSRVPGTSFGLPFVFTCRAGDTHPDCLSDADGDGAPARGDCNESAGNAQHWFPFYMAPGEDPVDGSGQDLNCDGWSLK